MPGYCQPEFRLPDGSRLPEGSHPPLRRRYFARTAYARKPFLPRQEPPVTKRGSWNHGALLTTHCPSSTFLLRSAATVVGFPVGKSEARREPSRSTGSSSFSYRPRRPPQHAHRSHRSACRARPNQNRLVLSGENFDSQLQSSRLPLPVAPRISCRSLRRPSRPPTGRRNHLSRHSRFCKIRPSAR